MEPAKVVEELWARTQARDWDGVGALVDEQAIVEWPVTAERMTGRDNYVGVNREYPEGWSIRVLRIVAQGDQVAAEVEVPHEDLGMFRNAAFYTVRDGRIVHGVEYWTTPGSEPRPEWREPFAEPM